MVSQVGSSAAGEGRQGVGPGQAFAAAAGAGGQGMVEQVGSRWAGGQSMRGPLQQE